MWVINKNAIRNSNISVSCRSNELKFLPVIESDLKIFSQRIKKEKIVTEFVEFKSQTAMNLE